MSRASRVGTLIAAVTLASACATLGRSAFVNPTVALKDVRVRGIGYQGGTVDVVLDVYNPNDYRLDASKVTYRLFVDTAQIATGEVNKLVTLENRKTSEVILPVTFTQQEVLGAVGTLMRMGSVDYRVTGVVTLATPFGTVTRPYDGKGRFDSLKP